MQTSQPPTAASPAMSPGCVTHPAAVCSDNPFRRVAKLNTDGSVPSLDQIVALYIGQPPNAPHLNFEKFINAGFQGRNSSGGVVRFYRTGTIHIAGTHEGQMQALSFLRTCSNVSDKPVRKKQRVGV